jgi:hypothetical protein
VKFSGVKIVEAVKISEIVKTAKKENGTRRLKRRVPFFQTLWRLLKNVSVFRG